MRGSSVPGEKHIQGNPLEFHLRMFAAALQEAGYRDRTMCLKLRLLADLGHWLTRTGQSFASRLGEQLLETFVKHKQRTQQMHGGDSKTLQQFLAHLRKQGVVSDRKLIPDESPLAVILCSYEQHLLLGRKLSSATIFNYLSFARRFLVERFSNGPLLFKEIETSDISDFVLRRGTMGVGTAQIMTTAFRSFFRYLFQKGELQADLAACVPAVADWRLSTVPKYVTPEEVEQVLKACNRNTAIGRRDYAVLLLVARLGLRAGEIVAFQLEDINWRAGEILVRGKGLLHDRMPLPPDVGQALASYLRRDRPACRTRRVFICTKAPRRGFANPSTLSTIVRRALARADLHPPLKGAHLLRHSLATSMLRSGATMSEIAEILRHRALNTTEIYAKVDFQGLRSLAHPWPMGGAQ